MGVPMPLQYQSNIPLYHLSFPWIRCCKEIKYVSFAESAKLCEAIPFKKLDPFPTLNDPEVLI